MRTRGWVVKSTTQNTYICTGFCLWTSNAVNARVFLTRFEAFKARNDFYAGYWGGVADPCAPRVKVFRRTSRRKPR